MDIIILCVGPVIDTNDDKRHIIREKHSRHYHDQLLLKSRYHIFRDFIFLITQSNDNPGRLENIFFTKSESFHLSITVKIPCQCVIRIAIKNIRIRSTGKISEVKGIFQPAERGDLHIALRKEDPVIRNRIDRFLFIQFFQDTFFR